MTGAAELAGAAAEAARRIRPYVRRTWLEPSPWLAAESGAEVFCKLENLQHAGSFKTRGAVNKLLRLPAERLARGVVAASTGNHGAAVAYALARLGARGLVFVPADARPDKLRAIERLGGELRRVEGDPVVAESAARRHAAEHDLEYVSPYNDLDVVAGQATVGSELLEDLAEPDALFVAVGGGGLVSGVAAVLAARGCPARVIGCSPAASAVMARSVAAGRILELDSQPTLSDGTAGGVEPGAVTFELCRQLVDEWVTVGEEEIAAALRGFVGAHSMLIEGAAAVAVAAFRATGRRFAGRRVAIVICGGNIGLETLGAVLAR